MGVNNENEPLSGTGPERRLFDKSLQPNLQNVGITSLKPTPYWWLKKKRVQDGCLQDLKGSDIYQGQGYWTWQAIVVESAILTETYKTKMLSFMSTTLVYSTHY
jgi:hypothetical protein